MAGIPNFASQLYGSSGDRVDLCSACETISAKINSKEQIPQAAFTQLSVALMDQIRNPEWASRPRLWFILKQMNRLDAMNAFITQGLNDTSLPFKSRGQIPNILNIHEFETFERWQGVIHSDICDLEEGAHITIENGDMLFDSRRPKLGFGGQGNTVVDEVTVSMSGRTYARKRINKRKKFGHDTKSAKTFENEIKALSKVCSHDHLIKVVGTYTDKRYYAMLLDPVADCNLKEFMAKRNTLASEQALSKFRTYFGCLAHTLSFLHEPPIAMIHKDLKPENILLKGDHMILTDFGTAYDWSTTGQSMTASNCDDDRTPRYQSPEVAREGSFHRSSDIWSLGVVFLEMATVLHGKSLGDLNDFLRANDPQGGRDVHPYQNPRSTLEWLDHLQVGKCGELSDVAPLLWIQKMLSLQGSNRPSAIELCEEIDDFQPGLYCGRCCCDLDSVSESESSFASEQDTFSDLAGGDETLRPSNTYDPPGAFPSTDPFSYARTPVPEANHPASASTLTNVYFADEGTNTMEPVIIPIIPATQRPTVKTKSQTKTQPKTQLLRKTQPKGSRTTHEESSSKQRVQAMKTSAGHTTTQGNKEQSRNQRMGFPGMDSIVQWLGKSHERLKAPRRKRALLTPKRRNITIESQRIGHFLSSLPDDAGDFVGDPTMLEGENGHLTPLSRPEQQFEQPNFLAPHLRHAYSDSELQVSDDEHDEMSSDQDLNEKTFPRLIKSGSDTNLALASAMSSGDRQGVFEELRAFAESSKGLLHIGTTAVIPSSTTEMTDRQKVFEELRGFAQASKTLTPTSAVPSITSESQDNATIQGSAESNVLKDHFKHLRTPITKLDAPKPTTSLISQADAGPSLATFIDQANEGKKRQGFESATIIMDRILKNKTAEAPTSIMSEKSRSLLAHGRIGMRWNDKSYGYLPIFTASGKVGAVRQLLKGGCNPGTEEKPRWQPIYNTIVGASDRHTKCLRELVEHGVDVNAFKPLTTKSGKRGKRPLHYALEQSVWSGYSTVIYILLAARANPNAKDPFGDVPLLKLLIGNEKLPQEKRDALYLLLAPNFSTKLNVTLPRTGDNPLHLAIQRKDAYVLDAILEKLKTAYDNTEDLIHGHNSTGFTPILLAFSILSLTDDEAENIRIVHLLLTNGANANDQHAINGETPLHSVVQKSKSAIALELLLRHCADPKIKNKSGKTPLALINSSRAHSPDDEWYQWADKRVEGTLDNDDWRPPALVSYLNDEAEARRQESERKHQEGERKRQESEAERQGSERKRRGVMTGGGGGFSYAYGGGYTYHKLDPTTYKYTKPYSFQRPPTPPVFRPPTTNPLFPEEGESEEEGTRE
ncbi:uncharacterized protein KY384_004644 [Bacidia gigantensis]|uniref:uncharacterized protein n=1 Tax=Bacidia gigantensis TaxID=2732470 RepID=UPI001D03AE1B|nr:uncharacterized protein KY384_004644 [Bacidia gigantensis]KAG8530606.1 hypothetical protein KY384_004644 [Bacidia gigantensis]